MEKGGWIVGGPKHVLGSAYHHMRKEDGFLVVLKHALGSHHLMWS